MHAATREQHRLSIGDCAHREEAATLMACAKYSGVIPLGANAWQLCIDRDVGDDLNEALASCLAASAPVVDYAGMAGLFQLIGARVYADGITNTVRAHDLLPNALEVEVYC